MSNCIVISLALGNQSSSSPVIKAMSADAKDIRLLCQIPEYLKERAEKLKLELDVKPLGLYPTVIMSFFIVYPEAPFGEEQIKRTHKFMEPSQAMDMMIAQIQNDETLQNSHILSPV
jgi:hypothetical protein